MSKIPFTWSGDNLVLLLDGRAFNVSKDHSNFKKIRQGLVDETPVEQMISLISNTEKDSVQCVSDNDKVVFKDNTVYFDGEKVEEHLQQSVRKLQFENMPFQGMLKFIGRLYGNTSYRARQELLRFVENCELTIDSEGYILSYKAVNVDYTDKYSGKISYKPGNVVSMDRAKVDDNADVGCSKGLHAGALNYVYWYGGGNDRIVIVKIDPADVVSVPNDSGCQKLRTCKLEVIGDYNGELQQLVYNSKHTVDDMYESDWENDQDEEDDFDWSEVEDDEDSFESDDEYIDDQYDIEDVNVIRSVDNSVSNGDNVYGVKPKTSTQAGRKYWNNRSSDGRFAKQ